MLTITIGETESWDKEKEEFVLAGGTKVTLEHSLVALSKWESIHEKPFLSEKEHTPEEKLSYILCMAVGEEIPPEVFGTMTEKNISDINDYINAKRTATWFGEKGAPRSREILTSELIYYWMFAAGIDKACEEWHLNRLITLIKVFGIKSDAKPKKMTKQDLADRRALNARRKAEMGTTG